MNSLAFRVPVPEVPLLRRVKKGVGRETVSHERQGDDQ